MIGFNQFELASFASRIAGRYVKYMFEEWDVSLMLYIQDISTYQSYFIFIEIRIPVNVKLLNVDNINIGVRIHVYGLVPCSAYPEMSRYAIFD